jgi:hypothetical protein
MEQSLALDIASKKTLLLAKRKEVQRINLLAPSARRCKE